MTPIYINSDTLVEWDELKNALTREYVNNATVRFTLKSSAGTSLATNVAMAATGSNGRYQGVVTQSVSSTLVENQTLWLEVTAVLGGYTAFRKIKCAAQYKPAQ